MIIIMGGKNCVYGPQELFENVLENELMDLDLDIPKIGTTCESSVKEYLIHFNLEDGKPEDYRGGRKLGVNYKVPSHGVSILLGFVDGHYHIKTQESPESSITRKDTLKEVRAKIVDKPNTYKTYSIGITIDWIADAKDYSILYRTDI